MASHGIRDQVAIVGMGCTPFGEHWDKSTDDLLIAVYRRSAERSVQRHAEAMARDDLLQALWEVNTDATRTTLALEFLAMANHRKVIQEEIARYAEQTGRDLSNITYYHIFAVFKLAVVIQQIFYRYHVGQTKDARFADFDKRVDALARMAYSMIQKPLLDSEFRMVE